MKILKYFLEFIIISILFLIFKIIGYKFATYTGSLILTLCGPFFRSKKKIKSNIIRSLKNTDEKTAKKIAQEMWSNYGRILAEYVFIKNFRKSDFDKFLNIEGSEILEEIKRKNEPVIFISGSL